MARSGDTVALTLDEVEGLTRRCLAAAGADAANAAAVAGVVTRAERDRAVSHGLFRVPGYCASLASGKVDGAARPEVRRLAPSVVQVDGRDGFAPHGPRSAASRCSSAPAPTAWPPSPSCEPTISRRSGRRSSRCAKPG